jgi:hypothetical protein
MVEENFTGVLLEIAIPRSQISRMPVNKALISLNKLLWHSPCFPLDTGQYGFIFSLFSSTPEM